MRSLIQNIIRKRNPAFTLPATISFGILIGFAWQQGLNLMRGASLTFRAKSPKMMVKGRRVKLIGISMMSWGRYLKVGDDVYINAISAEGITLGEKVGIGAFSRLVASGDMSKIGRGINIGNNVGIGEFAYLGGAGGLCIGDNCIVGQYFSCHPENHCIDDTDKPFRLQGVTRKGITIGNNCWIGSKVTILDGVSVGDNCVIAAGAVVNKSFPAGYIIGGVPARIIKKVNDVEHQKEKKQITSTAIAI
jgi:acetyltransferase-like isoleucine patch superfamily enzyme